MNVGYLLVAFVGLITGVGVFAAAPDPEDIEYISPKLQKKLERDFARAKWDATDVDLIKAQKSWTCNMYGVSTRMQVKRGVKLYAWKLSKNKMAWENEGAQPVIEYHVEKGVLAGKSQRFEDEVKANARGQLLSRLTVTQPERKVVAYSVCKEL
ncbi:MAG: hypothetical protein AB7G93_01655 [Bdellovibrionales bacterium]